ncbi:ATP-binding cassette domain-containing protein [Stakelama saccharophila]|uniref:ATP-binding cassette domain-containing protein n=1 Tax=Stakelama saccharophila TaxID=3075605 RepID=A0ABZ0BAX9_9SPHN|nr:ATP-binding cassette domain-containing protein [Stakelama sp. W311]WNO54508.1 ATP-binding cassette domain-containing protein [Stakelama sp. W311]
MPAQSETQGPRVVLEQLSKRYPGGTLAVDEVSLDIAGGQFVALVGASGSGKSTLLKMINRLIEPTGGSIAIGDEVMDALPAHELRRRIGYVFQNVGLFPHMTVGENVSIGMRLRRQKQSRERVAELLELVELPRAAADRMPAALSGGQRQRVGFARALATEPKLMLMDEPFGALDPVTRDALVKEYRALHERLGLTTIMVTHDMAEALLLAERVLVMKGGHIVADSTPHGMLTGEGGEAADELVAVPREQAHALSRIEAEE